MKKNDYLLFIFLLILAITGLLLHFHLNIGVTANAAMALQDSRQQVQLPILMYHSIVADPSDEKEYQISQTTLEKDLEWLSDHGFTTVSMEQLIAYTRDGTHLPEKPILLTFDDGYCNNYTLAFPLLQSYHAKAIISVIGRESDKNSLTVYRDLPTCNLAWGEVSLLANSGFVEIGNHTYDLHHTGGPRKGASKIKGEAQKTYHQLLRKDLGKNQYLIETATGSPSQVFAWPFGEYPADGSATPILKELGFKASLTSYQIMNIIEKGNPDSLFGLKRFLRTPEFDLEKLIN